MAAVPFNSKTRRRVEAEDVGRTRPSSTDGVPCTADVQADRVAQVGAAGIGAEEVADNDVVRCTVAGDLKAALRC